MVTIPKFIRDIPRKPYRYVLTIMFLFSLVVYVEKRSKFFTKHYARRFQRSLMGALVWWATFLYITKYLDPQNEGNVEKFYDEAFYKSIAGGIRIFVIDYAITGSHFSISSIIRLLNI